MLKDKLSHVKKFEGLFEYLLIPVGSPKPKVAWSSLLTGVGESLTWYRESAEVRKGNYLTGHSLKPRWLFALSVLIL